jgi:hypothetical protein
MDRLGDGNDVIEAVSLADLLGDPPPVTVTVLTTVPGALAATLTVSVIGG